jgi:hypothetical protein
VDCDQVNSKHCRRQKAEAPPRGSSSAAPVT